MFIFKPLKARIALVVSLEDKEPTKFDSMRQAVRAISVGESVIGYAKNNVKDYVRRFKGGSIEVFSIKWCST